ncbi:MULTISPECIES: hypothetical protein [unclassified Enterococcus]|jgi:hypothetical protein|uniref:hypothetical protein n=1 Tax=unclassified Enterococcus TaxID=2608891 RepID=UPI003D282920
MKKSIFRLLSFLFVSASLATVGNSSIIVAAESIQYTQENAETGIVETEEQALNELANLTINQLLEILKEEGYNPYSIFSEEEVQQARFYESITARAGANKVFHVNNETRDVYLNSYIATTLKYVGFAAVGKYVSGWAGIAVGAIGANINTGRGIIVRVNKQPGWKWGVNGHVWAIIGIRSQ